MDTIHSSGHLTETGIGVGGEPRKGVPKTEAERELTHQARFKTASKETGPHTKWFSTYKEAQEYIAEHGGYIVPGIYPYAVNPSEKELPERGTGLEKGVIPPGLAKRWQEFGDLSRECWRRVKELELPVGEAFSSYWSCMASKGAHLMAVEEAIAAGVEPHPICILAKVSKGIPEAQAREACLREGKFHGVSLIAAEARKAMGE